MATAMRSVWILSILASSAFCTSSMISGLASRTSLMMLSSSLRWAGVNALAPGAVDWVAAGCDVAAGAAVSAGGAGEHEHRREHGCALQRGQLVHERGGLFGGHEHSFRWGRWRLQSGLRWG